MQSSGQVELLLKLHGLQSCDDGSDKAGHLRQLEERLDPLLSNRYNNLKKRKGTGVAVLKNGACSECMIIYPDTHEIMRQRDIVHICEYCGRLLVVPDTPN